MILDVQIADTCLNVPSRKALVGEEVIEEGTADDGREQVPQQADIMDAGDLAMQREAVSEDRQSASARFGLLISWRLLDLPPDDQLYPRLNASHLCTLNTLAFCERLLYAGNHQ